MVNSLPATAFSGERIGYLRTSAALPRILGGHADLRRAVAIGAAHILPAILITGWWDKTVLFVHHR